MTTWTSHRITVPGASLHAEVAGPAAGAVTSEPLLAIVGHPMGGDDFRDLAEQLTPERAVLLHDPRGFGASPLDDPEDDADPDRLADDLAALLDVVVPGQRVDVFGSSGGAVTGFAFAARHPGRLRTLVAHEPPLIDVLPDRAERQAQAEGVVRTLHEHGLWPAMGAFMGLAGFEAPPPPPAGQAPPAEQAPPSAEQVAAMTRMIGKGLLTICGYSLDLPALRAAQDGGARLLPAAGEDSGTQMPRRAAEAVAALLEVDTTSFPGDHAPWVTAMGGDPQRFAVRLREVLDGAAGGTLGA